MTYIPAVGGGGLLGYRLLTATEGPQREAFAKSPEIKRDLEYFAEKIGEVKTAEALVSDRRLLRVALGAFGMDEEIDKRAFLRKVLEEGSENREAFAYRFVDPRYARFARAFGFGDTAGVRTGDPGFATGIATAYIEQQFEVAVGDQDETMRLALNFKRTIGTYANASDPDGVAWFSAMGDQPIRRVLEGALGLSSSIGSADVDIQRDSFRASSSRIFGDTSLAVFKDPEKVDAAIRRFIVRESALNGPNASSPGFAALQVLSISSIGFGSFATQNLFQSQF